MLVTLVPPAVFIAVMALQLRFFRPRSIKSTSAQVSSQATLDIYSLLPKAFHKTLNKLNEFDVEDSDDEDDGLFINEICIYVRVVIIQFLLYKYVYFLL